MGRFSNALAGMKKRDNTPSARSAKIEIRQNVMAAIGGDVHVFDAFAGEGHMYRAVWSRAASYTGCDTRWFPDERLAFVCENQRVMRAIDLQPFNLFDFDSHGAPWEQVTILAKRRRLAPGERLGVIMTDGSGMKLKMGSMSHAFAILAGTKRVQMGLGGAKTHDALVTRAINRTAELMGARVTTRWQATGHSGSRVIYTGAVLEQG
jgi:hypothetical protein